MIFGQAMDNIFGQLTSAPPPPQSKRNWSRTPMIHCIKINPTLRHFFSGAPSASKVAQVKMCRGTQPTSRTFLTSKKKKRQKKLFKKQAKKYIISTKIHPTPKTWGGGGHVPPSPPPPRICAHGVGDLWNEPRLLRMGVSIVELNVLDINFITFHNSSHSRLMGGGGCSNDKW